MNQEKIVALEEILKNAAVITKELAADVVHGNSPVAAGLRSVIEHGIELLAVHQQWIKSSAGGTGVPPVAAGVAPGAGVRACPSAEQLNAECGTRSAE
jgi:hypothetical protein